MTATLSHSTRRGNGYKEKLQFGVRGVLLSNAGHFRLFTSEKSEVIPTRRSYSSRIADTCLTSSSTSNTTHDRQMEKCTAPVLMKEISEDPETICEDQSNSEDGSLDRKPPARSSQSSTSTVSDVVHDALSKGNDDIVLALEGKDAQEALDVMQQMLSQWGVVDGSETGITKFRHSVHRVMRRLSYSTEKLPTAFKLEGVECSDGYMYGTGGYADVFCGSYGGKKVALKRLRIFQMVEDSKKRALRQAFNREALMWQRLNHKHILPFLGISEQVFPGALCMVAPWLAKGNALQHLAHLVEKNGLSGKAYLDTIHRWLLETALGLQYLHKIDIIHGDVRGPNLLVGDDESIRLGDFGLSAVAEVGSSYASSSEGAWGWMAPELLDPEAFGLDSSTPTRASDVYSFASVCIELYTGKAPFSGTTGRVLGKVLRGIRPPRPRFEGEDMIESLWNLLNKCWSREPSERPSIDDVVVFFEGVTSHR